MDIGKPRGGLRRSWALAAVALSALSIAGVLAWPQAAWSKCTISGKTATCDGDISAGVSFSDFSQVVVRDLSAELAPAGSNPGVRIDNSGGEGDNARALTISFDGAPFGVTSGGNGITGRSEGGKGKDGKSVTTVIANATGESGEGGGSGRSASVTLESGSVTGTGASGRLVNAVSVGGKGGSGGEGKVDSFGTGTGGKGGRGGDSDATSVTVTEGSFSSNGANGLALVAISEAGDGGDGGEGRTLVTGEAFGGDGRDGGSAGSSSISLQDGSIAVKGSKGEAIRAASQAGDGGKGGESNSSAADSGAGDGGGGGDSSAVSVTLGGGTVTIGGGDGLGLFAVSQAGKGGDGGEAFTGGGNSDGGDGGDGGTAATAALALSGGSLTVAPGGGTAMTLSSLGGDAGSGAKAQTDTGGNPRGGDGGNGGASDGATLSVTGGSFTQNGGGDLLTVTSSGGKGGDGSEGNTVGGGNSFGGKGGKGGNGGVLDATLAAGSFMVGSDGGGALSLRSLAGEGGDGGEDFTGAGNATGGDGGAGGSAGKAGLSLSGGSLSIHSQGGSTAIALTSEGSDGGSGGFAQSDAGGVSTGGAGGDGGASDGAALTVAGGSFTQNGAGDLLLVTSSGGKGGDGGEGRTIGAGNSFGGKGGQGGAGGRLTVALDAGTFAVGEDGGTAIFLQSLGGDGGNGGDARTDVASKEAKAGDGGKGGDGGAIAITSQGQGLTISNSSMTEVQHGVRVESIARGGGDGGEGGSDVIGNGDGGDGGQGGAGGAIAVQLTADIATSGPKSQGIFARSYGGDGGDGGKGFAVGGDGRGGAGAGSGPAGSSTLSFDGSVETGGSEANAVIVQSVGGFSGDAGASGGFQAFGAGSQSAGAGGTVEVTIAEGSRIATEGNAAAGVFAHSVGGGGGRGSNDSGVIITSLGGDGSAGGDGGRVTLSVGEGKVSTQGQGSRALHAASRGGGGGDSGSATGIVAVGASGGSGGAGGSVMASNAADLTTVSGQSDGFYAVSTGGGGGSSHATKGIVSIGGTKTGGGGDGGTVMGSSTGHITTKGDDSDGIFLHSVGGGGGDGSAAYSLSAFFSLAVGASGGDGGSGGSVTFDDGGASGYQVSTSGTRARGLLAQSIGGGGGDGGNAVAVSGSPDLDISIGGSGSGGKGGAGGAVTVTTGGDFSTGGGNAHALFAMSAGGGGGSSGTTIASANGELGVSMAIGGAGGGGGDGGSVTVTADGSLETKGDNSGALLAHSTGGGGGHGGTTVGGSAISTFSLSVAAGGDGGDGGDGGKVSIAGSGIVSTKGNVSPGIYAHSVGGGGGFGGTTVATTGISAGAVDIAVGGSGAKAGMGESVTVTVERDITTQGDVSSGLTAISSGGGGGYSGTTISSSVGTLASSNTTVGGKGGGGGDASTVTVHSDGSIETMGHSSLAIEAHSVGGGGGAAHLSGSFSGAAGGAANVTVGGSGGAAGDGGAVTVTSQGSLATQGHNAPGITAFSVGGGGGDSGYALSGAGISAGAVDVSVGGNGGASGNSGPVSVTTSSDITTEGGHAVAIRAKSITDGGGDSGLTIDGSAISAGNIGVTVGGEGGSGGKSGSATIVSSSTITTGGGYAYGLEAQSIAGGGGSAKGSVSGSGLSMGDVSVTVGGKGGKGGTAGSVTVTSSGSITTEGHHAFGIVAQSHGGAGGNGGFAAEGSFTGGEVSGQVGVTIGGEGNTGGIGGAVTLHNMADITTGDFGAFGILAQSTGGSGGSGGNVYTGNLSFDSDGGAQVDVDVGGGGGSGGKAGMVEVTNIETITTDGFLADGILAQSIGGNGGNGGNSYSVIGGITANATGNVEVDVGGGGGSGAVGGDVTITNEGTIETKKGEAAALRGMSIGGNGGRGGSAANINLNLSPRAPEGSSVTLNVNVSVGGNGGNGNDGGTVTLTNSGSLVTEGEVARGMIAHSVGGGGGDGGSASSISVSFSGPCDLLEAANAYECRSAPADGSGTVSIKLPFDVVVGGEGKGGGDGGEARADNQGSIQTSGKVAHGIVAWSHGGGGGNGGEGDLGLAGWTTNQTAESIAQLEQDFEALSGPSSIAVAVGGSGGAAGDGGTVMVANSGSITTEGDHAYAIHAQSIGGGGGNGGAGSGGFWTAATVGGRGSGGGTGGEIAVMHSGTIETRGEGGVGIFAQSVGGGGGTAGDVEKGLTESWLDLNIGVGVGVQENAGNGGDGGPIALTTSGTIKTSGEAAHGVMLQSVGGSGGGVGISGLASDFNIDNFLGNAGDAGNGGAITATIAGAIDVSGKDAHGLFAQSTSGTAVGDTSGEISVAVKSDITASGEDARGILAQSASGDGTNNKISITIDEGATVKTSAEGRETIGLFDGRDNSIVNNGSLLQEGGVDAQGHVIRTNGTAALSVENNGLLEGSIRSALSSTSNGQAAAAAKAKAITITNNAGAVFGLGREVTLGNGGSIANTGTLSAISVGTIGRSEVDGSISQGAGGTILVDFAFGGGHDFIVLDGSEKNALAGSITPNPLSGTPTSGSKATVTILRSDAEIDSSDLTVASTATVDYSLDRTTGSQGRSEVRLAYKVDYTPWDGDAVAQAKVPDGLRSIINDNHDAFGGYVDSLAVRQDGAGDREKAFVQELALFLVSIDEVGSLVDTYDRFAPGEIFAPSDAAFFSSLRFTDSLMSCPKHGQDGAVTFTRQGSCLWLRANGGGISRQRTGESIEYDETLFGFSGGGQSALGDGYFAGLAFSYEDSSLSNERVSGDGSRFQGGIVVKKEIEATTLSASLSGGISDYNLSRGVITPAGTLGADSDPTTNWVSAHARAAHRFDLDERLYLQPRFDAGLTYQWQGSFQESGAGDYGLNVSGFNTALVTLNPMLEFGGTFDLFGAQARAGASAGLLAVVSGRDRNTDVRFLGADDGPTFLVTDQARPLFADLGASLDVAVHDRAVISLSAGSLLSGNQQEYGGAGRISLFF